MKRKAQSYLDYAALMIIVGIALATMSSYVFRSISARMGHINADLRGMNGIR